MADGKVTIQTLLDETGVKSGLGKLNNTISSGIKVGVKAVAAGTAAVTAGVVSIGKSAVSAFASYEQLVGGVDTLFKKSSKQVQHYADIAYKTAQMSANDYMETVTSFSASLIQGLGGDTKKAAKLADKAIIDMSDNANKMGTDIELIKNAYQGFAKGNFTMLDNLKLGYGGTKTEMARLINDTKVLGDTIVTVGQKGNFDKVVTFDKMIEAIHKVQGELGITGTSAKEASSTIEGSANAMKASWENLLTGIGRGEDFDRLFDEFLRSFQTYMDNLEPVIENVIDGIGKLAIAGLKKLYPVIEQLLSNVPDMLSTIVGIVEKIMPRLFNVVLKSIPKLWNYVTSMVLKYVRQLLGADVSKALSGLLNTLSGEFIKVLKSLWSILQQLVSAVKPIVVTLLNLASSVLPLFGNAVSFISDNFDTLYPILMSVVSGFIAFKIVSVVGGLLSALPTIISSVITVMSTLNTVIAANPIGALAIALGAVTSAVIYFSQTTNSLPSSLQAISDRTSALNEHIENSRQELNELSSSYRNLSESSDSRVFSVQVEMDQTRRHWEELKKITDENGNIKRGYEDRAQYITGELSSALGTEITITNNQIQGYDKLSQSIQRTMAMKKLEMIMDAKKDQYTEALEKKDSVYAQYIKDLDTYTESQKNYKKAVDEVSAAQSKLDQLKKGAAYNKYVDDGEWKLDVIKAEKALQDAMNVQKNAKKTRDDANKQQEESLKSYDDMIAIISNFDTAEKSMGTSTAKMSKSAKNLATNFKKYGEVSTTSLGQQVKDLAEKYLNMEKEVKAKGGKIPKATKKQMDETKKELIKASKEFYNASKDSGENLLEGYIKGVQDRENRGGLAATVSGIIKKVLKIGNVTAQIKSPSRKTLWSGRMLAQGWVKGFTKEDPAGQIVKTVKYGASSIQEAMNRDLKLNMNSTIESNMGNIGDAMVSSLEKAGLSIDVEGRQFGRLVRRYG